MTSATYRNFSGTGPENYERYFVPAIGTPFAAELLATADLQTGERVLDVACGTGVVARLAAEAVGTEGSVSGVDVSADMIDVAKSVAAPAGSHIEWHVADATELPLPDGSFDVVFCQMGLMFMEDRAAAVAEMRRVLTPGGRLVVNTPGAIQRPFELMEEAIVEHVNPELGGFVRAVFSMHDPDGLAALLREGGFDDVSATVASVALDLPAPADFLWQYINLTPMGPFVAEAPEEAQRAMEQRVVETWEPFVTDGRVRLEQPAVIGSARA